MVLKTILRVKIQPKALLDFTKTLGRNNGPQNNPNHCIGLENWRTLNGLKQGPKHV